MPAQSLKSESLAKESPPRGRVSASHRRSASLLLCWLWLGSAAPAAATPPTEATAQHEQQSGEAGAAAPAVAESTDPCMRDELCRKLVFQAFELSRKGHREEALHTYQAAYVRVPMPWLLVNVGRMEQKLGRCEAALATYNRYLAIGTADSPGLREDVKGYVAQCELLCAPAGQRRAPLTAADATRSDPPAAGIAPISGGNPVPSRSGFQHPGALAGLGLSIATLAAGVTSGALALTLRRDAETLYAQPGSKELASPVFEQARSLGYATDSLLAIGSVSLGVTVIATLIKHRLVLHQSKGEKTNGR